MAANTPYDAGRRVRQKFPMPDLYPLTGDREAVIRTAKGGLFFGEKPTRFQLQQDAETGFFFEQIGYASAIALLAEIAEKADDLGYGTLASAVRKRIAIRLEGSPS